MYENPELRQLFTAYSDSKSPARASIADHLTRLVYEEHRVDPLIIATATDLAVFPAKGLAPHVQGFRLGISGFTELTAISHFGPAVASLVAIAQRGHDDLWRSDAEALVRRCRSVQQANSAQLWRDLIRVDAFAGREDAIAAMVDHACALTDRYLTRALSETDYLNAATLRRDFLDAAGQDVPVSMNRIMIATFALYALDFTHRLLNGLMPLGLEWERTIFAISGRQGRPTAGTTKTTTNLARILRTVSGGRLPERNIFVAPTLPSFPTPENGDLADVIAAEEPTRWQIARVMSSTELAPIMYDGYPRFAEPGLYGPSIDDEDATVSEMPPIADGDDWFTMITRLRLTLEDPRQLLAAGVTDFIAELLMHADNDPAAVLIPGLDGEVYTSRPEASREAAG